MLRALLSPLRLAVAGVALLAAVFAFMLTRQSDKFLEVPDEAHTLTGLVRVPGGTRTRDGGAIYYVDVILRRASLLQESFSLFRPDGSDLIDEQALVPCGISFEQSLALERETMRVSQEKASVVALRALGFDVRAHAEGVRVVDVDPRSNAHGVLRAQDVVVSADGRPIHGQRDLFNVLQRHRIGDTVRLSVRRGDALRAFRIRTIGDQCDRRRRRAIIGFIPFEVVDVHLPFRIHFNLRDVGGPSAGLAFALEVLEQRGRDVDHGLKVAATGEIQLDGTVTRIGGIKQKTIGAREAHVDAFLVPVDGDNAKVAKRYAHGLRIIPVKSFQQALQSLATLRPKA